MESEVRYDHLKELKERIRILCPEVKIGLSSRQSEKSWMFIIRINLNDCILLYVDYDETGYFINGSTRVLNFRTFNPGIAAYFIQSIYEYYQASK